MREVGGRWAQKGYATGRQFDLFDHMHPTKNCRNCDQIGVHPHSAVREHRFGLTAKVSDCISIGRQNFGLAWLLPQANNNSCQLPPTEIPWCSLLLLCPPQMVHETAGAFVRPEK